MLIKDVFCLSKPQSSHFQLDLDATQHANLFELFRCSGSIGASSNELGVRSASQLKNCLRENFENFGEHTFNDLFQRKSGDKFQPHC